MDTCFWGASSFNQPIGRWDVSKCVDMNYMFRDAIRFNADISSWDVSSVRNMTGMFDGAYGFEQDLCSWGARTAATSEVVDMFSLTKCPNTNDPNLSQTPPGPFCFTCSSS